VNGITRQDVIDYLRELADSPDGVTHRAWLFHAALLLRRDVDTVFVSQRPEQERHGDQTI
jgi:hypothetical protein